MLWNDIPLKLHFSQGKVLAATTALKSVPCLEQVAHYQSLLCTWALVVSRSQRCCLFCLYWWTQLIFITSLVHWYVMTLSVTVLTGGSYCCTLTRNVGNICPANHLPCLQCWPSSSTSTESPVYYSLTDNFELKKKKKKKSPLIFIKAGSWFCLVLEKHWCFGASSHTACKCNFSGGNVFFHEN